VSRLEGSGEGVDATLLSNAFGYINLTESVIGLVDGVFHVFSFFVDS
jgi:hypothetical protein